MLTGWNDRSEIPPHLKAKADEMHHILVEKVGEADDAIMEKYLNEEPVTPEELKAGIRRGVLKAKFLPILAGTALRNRGVQPILDAVVDFLPSRWMSFRSRRITRTIWKRSSTASLMTRSPWPRWSSRWHPILMLGNCSIRAYIRAFSPPAKMS